MKAGRPFVRAVSALAVWLAVSGSAAAQEPVRLYAAGSLRGAMTAIGAAFAKDGGTAVAATFGPSGLLRERIEKGEPAEVFASADIDHPMTLMRAGKAGPVVVFTRNRLCALARPGLDVSTRTLLDTLLDPAVKLGTSTPKADPLGDYTWAVFDKAGKARPGSDATLKAKALQLVGGPNIPSLPADQNLLAVLFAQHQADIFLTYCSGAKETLGALPAARIVALPPALAMGADYGLTVVNGARPEAARLALYVLSPAGQRILSDFGFTAVALPASDRR